MGGGGGGGGCRVRGQVSGLIRIETGSRRCESESFCEWVSEWVSAVGTRTHIRDYSRHLANMFSDIATQHCCSCICTMLLMHYVAMQCVAACRCSSCCCCCCYQWSRQKLSAFGDNKTACCFYGRCHCCCCGYNNMKSKQSCCRRFAVVFTTTSKCRCFPARKTVLKIMATTATTTTTKSSAMFY